MQSQFRNVSMFVDRRNRPLNRENALRQSRTSGKPPLLGWHFELDRTQIYQGQVPICCCSLDSTNRFLLIGASDGQVNMFDTAKSIVPSATVSRGQYLTCDIKTVQFMPGEHGVFQTLTKRKLVIWDTSQFVPAETMRLNTLSSPAMSAFRSNGKQICITHNDGVNFYDFKSGSIRAEISDTKLSGVLCCDWSSTKSVLLAVGTAKGEMFLYDVRQSKQPVLCYHKRKRKLDKGINELPVDQVKFGLCDASLWAMRRNQGVFEMSKKGVVINSINANLVQKFKLVKVCQLTFRFNKTRFTSRTHFVIRIIPAWSSMTCVGVTLLAS